MGPILLMPMPGAGTRVAQRGNQRGLSPKGYPGRVKKKHGSFKKKTARV